MIFSTYPHRNSFLLANLEDVNALWSGGVPDRFAKPLNLDDFDGVRSHFLS